MTEDDVLQQTGLAYLALIHPDPRNELFRQKIAPVVALAGVVPDEVIASLLTGASWRERLVGLCLAMAHQPIRFIEPMLESLRDPRGISLVPAIAALTVLSQRGLLQVSPTLAALFDREVFDGEIGWALDKMMHAVGLQEEDVPGRGPNYHQIFEDHVEIYDWVYSSRTPPSPAPQADVP